MLIAPIRGWCNRQHNRFWPCHWGFESSPPSPPERELRSSLAPSSSGLGRRPLKAVTAVRICSGLPEARDLVPGFVASRADRRGAHPFTLRVSATTRRCRATLVFHEPGAETGARRARTDAHGSSQQPHVGRVGRGRARRRRSTRAMTRSRVCRARASRGAWRASPASSEKKNLRPEVRARAVGPGHRVTTARETRRRFCSRCRRCARIARAAGRARVVRSHRARVVARGRGGGNA